MIDRKDVYIPRGYCMGGVPHVVMPTSLPMIIAIGAHEGAHALDQTWKLSELLRPTPQLKGVIVDFDLMERRRLLWHNRHQWPIIHRPSRYDWSIMYKCTGVLLNQDCWTRFPLPRLVSTQEALWTVRRYGSEFATMKDGRVVPHNPIEYRNLELPADFALVAGLDVFQRSVLKALIPPQRKPFVTYTPAEQNKDSYTQALELYQNNMPSPSFYFDRFE